LPLLQAEGVSVRFGGLQAVSDVDLEVERGTITGLIGPNGAGKTTTFNVISGLQPPTSGRVVFEDIDVSSLKTHERARLGIARTFQRLEVFWSLTARQNILVAAEIRNRWSKKKIETRERAEQILDLIGLRHVADERADAIPTGLARLVELGRALASGPRLVLLDEPGSGLNEQESDAFAELLLRLAEEGLAILLVEHDVELVMRVCQRIHVLDYGRIIAVGTPSEIQSSEVVQAAYLGAETGGEG
jgi:branched-chain amino acid transport system ATP-binding protein